MITSSTEMFGKYESTTGDTRKWKNRDQEEGTFGLKKTSKLFELVICRLIDYCRWSSLAARRTRVHRNSSGFIVLGRAQSIEGRGRGAIEEEGQRMILGSRVEDRRKQRGLGPATKSRDRPVFHFTDIMPTFMLILNQRTQTVIGQNKS